MECSERAHATEFTRFARRNNSLSSSGRLFVFAFLFIVSIGIAAAFAVIGAWPILPFAGLEMGVLYLAFRVFERHAADYERIAIAGDRVEVEICEAGRARCHEFNRYWAQVVSGEGARLALRSHGREVEIGRHLNDDQRRALARELGRRLHGTAGH
ncbi:MAG: DUF2244 domain-containing protein [Betaproteobacteria bacterium]|nr:DUF2244 domain-containing protein [Betaproteobacteria bacterium]